MNHIDLVKLAPLRPALDADVPRIRYLVNAAYKELADRGLNYTATYQDERITRERMQQGQTFVLEHDGELIATVLFKKENFFTGRDSAYVSQLAVAPAWKRHGLGNRLMDFCEELATQQGHDCIQLDTAQPALHLVTWYQNRGYRIVGETRWDGKTYLSWIFEKDL